VKKLFIIGLLAISGCAPAYARDTITTVAMTLWGESRSESYAGKSAVASTIWNRANGKAANMKAVCLSRKQYSCWRKRVFTQALPDLRKPLDRMAWRDCVTLATIMVNGTFLPDIKAKHYHEASITPKWSINMTMLASVDNHIFYK
jgi:spore germination cell wall hydrolase CwlJ-like protein